MKVVLALAFFLAVAFGLPQYRSEFEQWVQVFNKSYASPVELEHRYRVFVENMLYIEDFNAKNQDVKLGMNLFGDLSYAEWRRTYLGCYKSRASLEENVAVLDEAKVPLDVDWRTKGAVTPVKNQGQCGSCWAFSTTGSVEGVGKIAKGQLVSLSEQELVDCSKNGNNGCSGGLMDYAFQWIIQNGGLCTESAYPYTARDGSCRKSSCTSAPSSKISGYKDVARNNEAQLRAAVTQQPVSVAIEADQAAFQFYKSGIFSAPCGTSLDHGVLAVGFGSDQGGYWIVKNSWGASWGNQGYIQMAFGKNNGAGQCGIAMEPSYPTA